MAQSGVLTVYPGSGGAPIGGSSIYYNGGGPIDTVAHELGHTVFGDSYLDYPGQDQGLCPSCPIGNVQVHQNAFRQFREVGPRLWHTETLEFMTAYGQKIYVGPPR